MGESSHDIQEYTVQYARGEKPSIELSTRQGQFEYVFLWCDFIKRAADENMPTSRPVISSLRYSVDGRENRFVRELDRFDLENMSRENSHELCDFRKLHDSGRGVLLHLGDFGLTESVRFGFKYRLALKFELTSTTDPLVETGPWGTTADVISGATRTFNIALIRHNRLLSGDIVSTRFEFLNEK